MFNHFYSSAQGGDYGFASSAASPMSVATAGGQTGTGSQSPSGSSGDENATSAPPHAATRKMVSSHYAQISPLRGQGLPHPSVMGIQNTGQNSALAESSVKSYFAFQKNSLFE